MLGRADDADRWAEAFDAGDLDPAVLDPARRAFVRSLIMRETPDDVRADAERAVSDPELDHSWRAPALLVLGGAYAIGGDRDAADAVLREAADTAAVACVPAIESAAVAYRSLLAAEVGAWPLADALAAQACRIVTDARLENDVTSLFAYAASSSAALRHGDWLTVHDGLQQSERLLPGLTYAIGSFAVILRLEFARVWSALGDREHALELLAQMDAILAKRPELEVLRGNTVELREEIRVPEDRESRSSTLTAAELRLLPLLTTHLSFREIADSLYVSRNTVKTQAISVYRKLGVSSRGEAVAHASRVGLVAGELHET
jgi:LuxR family maltose regulon positive regulatory protein